MGERSDVRTGADLVITPCLLGGIFKATNNRAPMIAFGEVPSKLAYERLEMERAANSEEFLDTVKADLFPDKVYVFTPKGAILRLPRGARSMGHYGRYSAWIEPDRRETYDGGVVKIVFRDPDGNEVGLSGALPSS